MGWQGGVGYFWRLQSLVAFLLLILISTRVFSRTRGVPSHLNSFTHRSLGFTEKLVLPRHAHCVLSRLRCNGHIFLLNLTFPGLAESSCSACGYPIQDTSHLILHCPATDSLRRSLFGDSLSLHYLWSRPCGSCSASGAP